MPTFLISPQDIILAKRFLSLARRFVDESTAAKPVIPEDYDELSLEDITQIVEPKREKMKGSNLGLVDNTEALDMKNGIWNIMLVYSMATESEVDFWSVWYQKAHEDVMASAARLNVPFPMMAGAVAIMSPGNKWGMNLRTAERAVRLASKIVDSPDVAEIESNLNLLYEEQAAIKEKRDTLQKLVDSEPDSLAMRKTLDSIREKRSKFMRELRELGTSKSNDKKVKILLEKNVELNEEFYAKTLEYNTRHPDLAELIMDFDVLGYKIKQEIARYNDLARQHGLSISSYPDNVRKVVHFFQSEKPSAWVTGPKVKEFYAALLKPDVITKKMVLDGHAINIWMGVKQPLSKAGSPGKELRDKMQRSYAVAARLLKTNTRSLQAVTWYIWKAVFDKEEQIVTPREQQELDDAR